MARYTLTGFADEIDPQLDVQLACLRRLGVVGLDLRSVGGINVLDLTDEQVREVGAKCAVADVAVQAVGSPVNKVAMTPQNRPVELAKLARAVEVASILGIRRIRIFTPEAPVEAWDEVKAWMREQVDLAEKAGMLLLHENDAKFYGAYPENAKRLFAEFGGPHFAAAFDFANTVLLGFRPWDDWFPWIVPYLDTLHIKDAAGGAILPAGEGDGQIARTLRFLVEQGWEGALTMEPHLSAAGPRGGFSGEDLFEVAVKALRHVAAEAGIAV